MNQSNENCPKIIILFMEQLGEIQKPLKINVIVNILLMITASLGNGIVIVAILRSQNLQTPSYLLITSLAFTDVLVGLVFHPLQIVLSAYYLQGNSIGICAVTDAHIFFTVYLGFASQLMTTFISIDRYLALTLRHRYNMIVTKNRIRLVIVVAWIMSILASIFAIKEKFYETSVIIYSCLSFLLLVITCICYSKSFRALHLYTVQVETKQQNWVAGNFDLVRYKKTLKTMVLVLACLVLCYTPLICSVPLIHIIGDRMETDTFQYLSFTVMALNSSVNPAIYLIRFLDIRNACKEMLRNPIY